MILADLLLDPARVGRKFQYHRQSRPEVYAVRQPVTYGHQIDGVHYVQVVTWWRFDRGRLRDARPEERGASFMPLNKKIKLLPEPTGSF